MKTIKLAPGLNIRATQRIIDVREIINVCDDALSRTLENRQDETPANYWLKPILIPVGENEFECLCESRYLKFLVELLRYPKIEAIVLDPDQIDPVDLECCRLFLSATLTLEAGEKFLEKYQSDPALEAKIDYIVSLAKGKATKKNLHSLLFAFKGRRTFDTRLAELRKTDADASQRTGKKRSAPPEMQLATETPGVQGQGKASAHREMYSSAQEKESPGHAQTETVRTTPSPKDSVPLTHSINSTGNEDIRRKCEIQKTMWDNFVLANQYPGFMIRHLEKRLREEDFKKLERFLIDDRDFHWILSSLLKVFQNG